MMRWDLAGRLAGTVGADFTDKFFRNVTKVDFLPQG